MRAPHRRGPGALAIGLFVVGAALISWDAWHWWRARHPYDDGSYGERADWSAKYGAATHFFGYVFRDRNRNGRQDPGEPPMAWVAAELTAPGGRRSILRTNLAGFANANMSQGSWLAPVHAAGDYRFRILVPPGFVVTTGNGDQVGRVAPLPGAPGDLVTAPPPTSVGLAPELSIAGRLTERAADGALRGARSARLSVTGPGVAAHAVPVAADGGFRFPAGPGSWRLVASSPASPAGLAREVTVGDAPAVVIGLVLGETGPEPAGKRVKVDFEGITQAEVSKIGFGYGIDGLDWGMLHVLKADDSGAAGYVNALSSGSYVAYSSVPVTLSRAGGFDFYGGYFTVGLHEAEGETLRVRAFRAGSMVADDEVKLSALGPLWLDARLLGVDRVVLSALHSWQFATDDLELSAREGPSAPAGQSATRP